MNIIVGFAPLKPAEFVVISIQQIAGQWPEVRPGRKESSMAEFAVNATSASTLQEFKFRVKMGRRLVAGVSKVGGRCKRTTGWSRIRERR